MTRLAVDVKSLGPNERADLLEAMAEDQPELASPLNRTAKAMRRIGGIQMPLIAYNPLPFGFDRNEKLSNGCKRWLTPGEAAPIMGCHEKTVYRRFAKNSHIGFRIGGGSILIDRLAIARFK